MHHSDDFIVVLQPQQDITEAGQQAAKGTDFHLLHL